MHIFTCVSFVRPSIEWFSTVSISFYCWYKNREHISQISMLSLPSFFSSLNRISQSASIITNDGPLQREANETTQRNRSEHISDSQNNVKFLVQNDSISLHINATHSIPLAVTTSPFQTTNESVNSTQKTEVDDGIEQLTVLSTKSTNLKPCPLQPTNSIGPIDVDIEYESLTSIEQRFHNRLEPGGCFKPNDCEQTSNRVAIVIPYRDRDTHLSIFLKNIHPFLMKQQADYGIFVVEQFGNGLFNRAALMNIGFLEAKKLAKFQCFIFHDVDLIPLDDRNLYRCPMQPRHMSVAIDTMQFK